MDEIKVIVRDAVLDDESFIMAHWLNGNRYGSPYFELQDASIYYKEYADKITYALKEPGVQVHVACDEANPSWLVGFIAMKENALLWIYVRSGYRKRGIAKLLIKERPVKSVKGLTKVGAAIAKAKGFIFQPL